MANYTSCKIHIEQVDGKLDLELFKTKLNILKEENNIGQTIQVYCCSEKSSFEIRFGSKWYASTIDEIFLPSKYEIWVIGSDEGGASDYVKYYPSTNSSLNEFTEKALYKFDEIELRGDNNKIFENLKEIFGLGINNSRRWNRGEFVKIELSGIYKSNNYFNHDYDSKVIFNSVDSLPYVDDFNDRTELWEMIWEVDGIDFRNTFYQEVLNCPSGKTQFDYIKSIKFKYKGATTNLFEWSENGERSNWEHRAINNYFNLVNTNYLMHQNVRNTEGNK